MHNYIKLVIRYRGLVLGLILLITALSGAEMSRGVIASSMNNFLGESPKYKGYLERIREFSNDEVIIIAFEEPALLSKPSLDKLKGVVEELEKLPETRRVFSILDIKQFKVSDGVLEFGRLR